MRTSCLLSLLVLCSCDRIVGLDEFHAATIGGTGGSAGLGSGGSAGAANGGTGPVGGSSGTSGAGAAGGAGATGGSGNSSAWPTTVACAHGYEPWVAATFSNPDGSAIGSSDFPGSPLIRSGPLTTASGRVETTGTAEFSTDQGGTLTAPDLRLRFIVSLNDAGSVVIATNSPAGLSLSLDSTDGRLSASSGGSVVAETTVGTLEPGLYYAELALDAETLEVALSRGSFPSNLGSILVASASGAAPTDLGSGSNLRVALSTSQGRVAIDDVSVARCSASPPAVRTLLADAFDDGLNTLDVPATSTWSAGSVVPTGGRARVVGNSKLSTDPITTLPSHYKVSFISRFKGASTYAFLAINESVYYYSSVVGEEFLPGPGALGESGIPPNQPDQDRFVTISVAPDFVSLLVELGGFGGSRAYLRDRTAPPASNPENEVSWSAGSGSGTGSYIEIDDLKVTTYAF